MCSGRCAVGFSGFRFAVLAAVLVAPAVHAGDSRVVARPSDTGEALVNPGMGWTMHYYSNIPKNYGSHLSPGDTVDYWPGLSTIYLRVPWAMIEPEEGRFNWAMLDTPAQRWIDKGRKVAFRITTSENWMRFATPEWVKNAGAKGTYYEFGKGPVENGAHWDPDFEDPVFLEKLGHFLQAMAARYDGNPDVAFVDVGSYGLWGEGHTFMTSQVPDEAADRIVRRHIDLYSKYFPRTQLVISDDIVGHDKPGRHFPLTDYAIAKGVTLRDDSILVQPPPRSWHHAEMAQEFWPKWPVVLEHEHYGPSKEKGAWSGDLLLKSVEDYHASYMSIHWDPRVEFDENGDWIDRINRRMGYRLQPREVSWPEEVSIGERFRVGSVWANAGVAPCYPGGFMTLTLKDSHGALISVLSDESQDMRDLGVGPAGNPPLTSHDSEFVIGLNGPVTPPGEYDVYLSVGRRDGTPVIALPLPDTDGERRYKLGKMTIRDAEVSPREGDLIQGSNDAVYYIHEGKRCHIPSEKIFNDMGFDWEKIKISDAALKNIPPGPDVSSPLKPYPKAIEGDLVQARGPVYLIRDGMRCNIPNMEIFTRNGFKVEDVVMISDEDEQAIPPGPALE